MTSPPVPNHMIHDITSRLRIGWTSKNCDICNTTLPRTWKPSKCYMCPEEWEYDECENCSLVSIGLCHRDHNHLPTIEEVEESLIAAGATRRQRALVGVEFGERNDMSPGDVRTLELSAVLKEEAVEEYQQMGARAFEAYECEDGRYVTLTFIDV